MAISTDRTGGYDTDLFGRLVGIEERSFWFRARNRLLVQLVGELTDPGDRLLEIGCGTGYVLRALVRECGLKGVGSELFAEGLDFARRRVPEAEFAQLDAREMPYDRDFDIVGAFDVLEHIDDDLGVLKGMYRAVRDGGCLVATVPQHRWLWSATDVHAHHVRRYRRQELLERVEQAGFTVVRVTSFVTSLLPLMALARWRDRDAGGAGYDPLASLVPPEPANKLFEGMLGAECRLIDRGISLPAGGSLVVVARR